VMMGSEMVSAYTVRATVSIVPSRFGSDFPVPVSTKESAVGWLTEYVPLVVMLSASMISKEKWLKERPPPSSMLGLLYQCCARVAMHIQSSIIA